MNERGFVYYNDDLAGILIRNNKGYIFEYEDEYFSNPDKKSISITMPKSKKVYFSEYLHPFFYNMNEQGINRARQCDLHNINFDDDFKLLLATSGPDTLGAVYVIGESRVSKK